MVTGTRGDNMSVVTVLLIFSILTNIGFLGEIDMLEEEVKIYESEDSCYEY